ncbi:mitochondrial ubiquitin ligase activator of NFKB 1-like [Anneissia japonica]|uniref:mitochondrial ubiquitin ligase activator of NFKB 1-like n=1 Tax=Anneissia japonica TaxID=1529436 RepID=UPI001425997B|nr:mitochondrial ubiquitin ligase activator of NFKB 1-like [Anneissia japonica]
MNSSVLKPVLGLAIPGIYLVYRYQQLRRSEKDKKEKRKITEKELDILNRKIEKLLKKLDKYDLSEPAHSKEEECVVCLNTKACIHTFPCGHKIICRKCFVKTIQIAVSQRVLPLRCVMCRTRIDRLKHPVHNTIL